MKTIGIIGGMSWESSLEYYRLLNEMTKERLGGLYSAKILMYSCNFQDIEELQHLGRWDEMAQFMTKVGKTLEQAGADFIVIATNTMHKLVPQMEATLKIPILHIADATAQAIKEKGLQKVALLGTKFTMEGEFYRQRLSKQHGIDVVIPNAEEREVVHDIIYNELCQGVFTKSSRQKYNVIIKRLAQEGAEGVVMGCTEIPLLLKQEEVAIPLFDTTYLHARAAVEKALE